MAKIVFCVDFNYYEMPKEHPYAELFAHEGIKEQVERNVLKADLVLVTNMALHEYLLKKFTDLVADKYKNVITKVVFGCVPYLIDTEIVFQNIEFESQKPEPIINKDIFKKVAEVAEEIKKEDLKFNKEKAIKINNKKAYPKKSTAKTTKVDSKGKKGKKGEIEEIEEKIENKNEIEAISPVSEISPAEPPVVIQEPLKIQLPIAILLLF